jgi:hypothetical protein
MNGIIILDSLFFEKWYHGIFPVKQQSAAQHDKNRHGKIS